MRILIDLDDTLVDMMGKALYYFNNRYHKERLQLEDLTKWDIPYRNMFEDIWRIPGFFADLPFMDNMAQDVLHALKADGHELVIVSAVPTWESCKDKYSWCHTNLKIPGIIDTMEQVVLTRGKRYVSGDCIVDDKPANLKDRKYPIVFDRPWNRHVTAPRATDWSWVYQRVWDASPPVGYERERGCFHLGGCI